VTLEQTPIGVAAPPALRLPTFLIIGAQKCGTSSLWAYLRQHPQVFVPSVKELNFFSKPGDDVDLETYSRWFADAAGAAAIGEASPNYTMFPTTGDVAAKIARVLPDVRLIYLMRDPVERIRSAYHHRLAGGTEHRRVRAALRADPTYLQVSMYATQVEQYLRWFPRSQLLLLAAEDLKRHRAATLSSVLSFIGLDPEWQPADLDTEHNTSAQKATAPRAFTRVLGDALIRSGAVKFAPRRIGKVSEHSVMRRPIRPSDTALSDGLREELINALRPELERLTLLMPPSFDAWGLLG